MAMFRAAQVILFSSNLPRVVDFYTRLGFTEVYRVPAEGEPDHVDLVLDNYRLGFAAAHAVRQDHALDPIAEGQRACVVLWTDDTRAAYDRLVADGAPALSAPHVFLGRLMIAWTADPDGHPVQIVQNLPPPKEAGRAARRPPARARRRESPA
jgi:glyoxylase I family protein